MYIPKHLFTLLYKILSISHLIPSKDLGESRHLYLLRKDMGKYTNPCTENLPSTRYAIQFQHLSYLINIFISWGIIISIFTWRIRGSSTCRAVIWGQASWISPVFTDLAFISDTLRSWATCEQELWECGLGENGYLCMYSWIPLPLPETVTTLFIGCESELVAQWCPTLKMLRHGTSLVVQWDHHPPDSSVHGIFQSRILEWDPIYFSGGFSGPRVQTWISCIVVGFFTVWATRKAC